MHFGKIHNEKKQKEHLDFVKVYNCGIGQMKPSARTLETDPLTLMYLCRKHFAEHINGFIQS